MVRNRPNHASCICCFLNRRNAQTINNSSHIIVYGRIWTYRVVESYLIAPIAYVDTCNWYGKLVCMTNINLKFQCSIYPAVPFHPFNYASGIAKPPRCHVYVNAALPLPKRFPDSKVHGASMGPIWGWQNPGGPHIGPMNLAIKVCTRGTRSQISS